MPNVMTALPNIGGGLGRFRYMTTSVHAKYHFGSSCWHRYNARERLSVYAEGLQMLKWMFSLLC